jgi:RNA polymerase sigma-70 factor, ECF subfamily
MPLVVSVCATRSYFYFRLTARTANGTGRDKTGSLISGCGVATWLSLRHLREVLRIGLFGDLGWRRSVVSGDDFKFGSAQPSLAELRRSTDEQLMLQLNDGVNDALAVLFERYQHLVFSIALKIVRDRGEAEDLTQNVFLEIYRSVAQFDPAKGTLKVWLLQFAYHRAFNRKKHLNARKFYDQESTEDIERFSQGVTSGKYAPAELQRLLHQGLASLSRSQKRVIELASYDGLSMKEIADKTGNSLSNVRHHYYRGLLKLRSFVTRPMNSSGMLGNDD